MARRVGGAAGATSGVGNLLAMGDTNDFMDEESTMHGLIKNNTAQSGYQSEGPTAAVVRKVHYMLHSIDMSITKIEARGQAAPASGREFKIMLKQMHEIRQLNLKEIK